MSQQSPMISIPKKSTDDVDWTTPIQVLVAQSYGERPENYLTECQNLQRCRQDAVRGAGSDTTARDLLYKYFGQLELLELRFAEIKVQFPWRDAFTLKLTTQTSLAFEKASIIFMLAAVHSSLGATQNRSDPESLKRAVYYFKSAAGMLNYINENFLHAPSTDLSSEVVKFLVSVMLAQATEVVFEKCVAEKKLGNALIAKIGAQAASMYVALTEEVKDFMGKGIFDRNWVTVIQIKAKYFTSLMQYYRGLADETAGKHGDALVRFTIAESNAKEANRTSQTLISYFVISLSPQLPADAGSSITELTKAHLALVSEKKKDAQRDNDLIYNNVLPAEGTLPAVEKTNVAVPITIQEVYGTASVQKTIGPDIFQRLIPLSVHEGASVYSEEKAKLVRGEVEKSDIADTDVRAGLESIGVKEGLGRFREMVDDGGNDDGDVIPAVVKGWRQEVSTKSDIESKLRELDQLSRSVQEDLDTASRSLETESRECEMMRVRYEHFWTQSPSATLTKALRQDLKSNLAALEQAQTSDGRVVALWNDVRGEVEILSDFDGRLEACFSNAQEGPKQDLLDLDNSAVNGSEDAERVRIASLVKEIDEKLGRINKLGRERNETLKDLKEKIQSDDVSHILLLNRRGSSFEPGLFAQELEKFKPFQQRVAMSIQLQQTAIQEIAQLWKTLKGAAGRGPGARKWEDQERKKMDTVKRFARAREGWMEVSEGLAKGLQFYRDLSHGVSSLSQEIKSFVTGRTTEREDLAAQAETQKRLSAPVSQPRPPLPPKSPPQDHGHGIESSMKNLHLSAPPPPSSSGWPPSSAPSASQPRPLPQAQQSYSGFPPPPPPLGSQSSYPPQRQATLPSSPPPPPDPYANLFNAPGLSSHFGESSTHQPRNQYATPPPPPPPQRQYGSPAPASSSGYQSPLQQQPSSQWSSYGSPPPQTNSTHSQYSYGQSQSSAASMFPPPPPPVSYQTQHPGSPNPAQQQPYGQPPPPQQQYQYGGYR